MDIMKLEAQIREAHGSRACRHLRKKDVVPAVLYGRNEPNVMLTLDRKSTESLLEEHTYIASIGWDGHEENAQIRAVQYDALGDTILHVDLMRISLTEVITVSVPLETHGQAAGIEEGGVLDIVLHELQVECLPTAIPEEIRVEVSELDIGDDLRISDLPFPEGVRPLDDPDTVVVVVTPPQEIEEEAEEALGVEAEPEVIGRQPADEESETEGAAGGA